MTRPTLLAASPIYYTSWTPRTYPEHINQTVAPLGLKPKFAPHCFDEYGYLAGTDKRTFSALS